MHDSKLLEYTIYSNEACWDWRLVTFSKPTPSPVLAARSSCERCYRDFKACTSNSVKPAGAARTSLWVAAPTPDTRLVIQGVRGLTLAGFRVRGDTSAKDCHIRECR